MNHRSELIEKLLASIRLQFTWPISSGRSLSLTKARPAPLGAKRETRRTGLDFTLNQCEIGSQFEQLIARRESLKYKNTVKPNGLQKSNDWKVT
jgi:hypothetical protein